MQAIRLTFPLPSDVGKI